MRYFCSPQHTDSALYPIISQMERAAGLAHGDTAQVKLDKLDALLAQTSTSKQDAALFAEMLSLPNDGRYPALNMDPQAAQTEDAGSAHRAGGGIVASKPCADDLRGRALDRPHEPGNVRSHRRPGSHAFRVLLIVTFRPEFDAPWIGRPYVTALTINRLAKRDIEAMIDRVVGNKLHPGGCPAGHHRAHRWHSLVRGGDD